MADEIKKKFGFWSIVLLGINGVIGSGLFLLPGKAMTLVGSGSIFVYLSMAIVVICCVVYFKNDIGCIFMKKGLVLILSDKEVVLWKQ